jgi:membrane peptidoglycan carboxypeptidase
MEEVPESPESPESSQPLQASRMRIAGGSFFGRIIFTFLVLCAIALGVGLGLLFVYSSDLPEIHALENYRPNIITELYADDGQSIGTFALQRRILLTYDQIPAILTCRAWCRRLTEMCCIIAWPRVQARSPCSLPADFS